VIPDVPGVPQAPVIPEIPIVLPPLVPFQHEEMDCNYYSKFKFI